MTVLGFDTSTSATAVAVRLADGRTSEARDDPPTGAHPGHATRLLALSDDLLVAAGVAWSEIDRVAVGIGPGTFTGLRVGVATARGLAQSLSAELVGVSSTRALAFAAFAGGGEGGERREGCEGDEGAVGWEASGREPGVALAVIDARRGEVFAAAYEFGGRGEPSELLAPRALAPPDISVVLVDISTVLADAGRDAGAAPGRWLGIGDGAIRFRGDLQAAGILVPPDSSPLHRVSAAAICELGACATAAGGRGIVPDYRRPPDAELALDAAGLGEAS
jgi:tRNA threonylcarbamoyladenosine biosynthesis protein TsaB